MESWVGYWFFVALLGAFSGWLLWILGGWWYRLRIRWSGCSTPDKRLARLTYVYSSFVHSGPTVLLAIIYTVVFANYQQAWSSDEFFSLVMFIFPFWSYVTSYRGVMSLFEVKQGRARLWFLILPCIFYVVAFGVLGTFYALVTQ